MRPTLPARRASLRRLATLGSGLGAAWLTPTWVRAQTTQTDPTAPTAQATQMAAPVLQPLLQQRLAYEGVALAAAHIAPQQAGPDFGFAAARGSAPDADTLFELGSITKTFTALLLADAVLRDEVKLDDAVEAVLPQGLKLRDSQGQPLRWRDLATHRSGLPRLPGNLHEAGGPDPYARYGWAEMQLFLQGWQARQPRDTAYAYSNLGYGLLGQALGLRAGLDYPSLLSQRVLQPLGLAGQIGLAAGPGQRLLPGHDPEGRPVPHWHFQPAMAGAGALLGSARGLARYAQAALGLMDHPLQAAFTLCLQPHGQGPNPRNPVGLAWGLAPLFDRTVFNHDGATAGFSSSLWLDPSRRRASLLLANARVEVTDLALHVLEPKVPPKNMALTRQAAQPLSAEVLAPLAGLYALNPQFKLRVRADGERLFAQASGQGEFELFAKPASEARRFFARITPLEVVFEGAAGPAQALTLYQGGNALRFVKE